VDNPIVVVADGKEASLMTTPGSYRRKKATTKVPHMFMAASVAVPLLAAGMLVGGPGSAHADSLSKIHSVVYWTGINCIPIRAPQYPNGRYTITRIYCGGYSEANYWAYPGEYVGADPNPNDTTTSLGCALYINGDLNYRDSAAPGDKHDVNCLRVLVGYDDGSAQSQL
jgi:hypothetical protein